MHTWKVTKVLPGEIDAVVNLEECLQSYESQGWEVFSVMPYQLSFVIVLRRPAE